MHIDLHQLGNMKSKKIKIPIYNGTLVIYQTKDLKDVEIKHDLTD